MLRHKPNWNAFLNRMKQWRIQKGAQQAPPPPLKFDRLWVFFPIPFCIRMLQNRAQIARESMKKLLELPGPLSGPWTPAERDSGFALVMCVRAHNLLLPPPPPYENPGFAPVKGEWLKVNNEHNYISTDKHKSKSYMQRESLQIEWFIGIIGIAGLKSDFAWG